MCSSDLCVGQQLTLTVDALGGGLSYDFGSETWVLPLPPAIRRKTEKLLPRYRGDADTFVLSGVEDPRPQWVRGTSSASPPSTDLYPIWASGMGSLQTDEPLLFRRASQITCGS